MWLWNKKNFSTPYRDFMILFAAGFSQLVIIKGSFNNVKKFVFSTLNWLYDYYYSFSVKPPSITAYVSD